MRAFQFAKNAIPGKKGDQYADDYIEQREFRIFLVALKQRFEYWEAFKIIDTGGDGRIDLTEFISAKAIIEKWVGPIKDMEAEFKAIDENGGG